MTVWCATGSPLAIFRPLTGHSSHAAQSQFLILALRFSRRLAASLRKKEKAPAPVQVTAVTQATIRRIVHGDGALFPLDQANLMPEDHGAGAEVLREPRRSRQSKDNCWPSSRTAI